MMKHFSKVYDETLGKISKMNYLRVGLFLFLMLGIILPVSFMLFQIKGEDFTKIFRDPNFYTITMNSMLATLIAAAIAISLALACAYLLSRASLKNKNLFIILLTVPMLIPSISHALGLINLFGTNGFLDKLFGLKLEIYGLWGIVVGSVMYSFPIAFLFIYDALKYENQSIYDAAATLGISKYRSFFGVTIPYLKKTLLSAFFAIFTMIFTDYGVPLAIGGRFSTLPVFLYQEVINRMNFSKGAVIGLVLLVPAIVAFVYDIIIKDEGNSEIKKSFIRPNGLFNFITVFSLLLVSFFLIIPQLSFLVTSFVKSFPNNMAFSLIHLEYAVIRGLWSNYFDSIIIALSAALFGTILAYMTAYLSSRIGGKVGKSLHFVSIVTMAVPGMVLGLGYIFLFRGSIVYGTMMILVVVNIIHFFASPYLMARNAFNKLNKNYESVGSTLGISRKSIFIKVLIPNTKNTLFEMFSYFFVNSMITISAIAFLYSTYNKPLALLIPQFEAQLSYEEAGIVSLLLLLTNIIFKIVLNIAKKITIKKEKRMKMLTRYEFDLLSHLEKTGPNAYTQRKLADDLTLSVGTINKLFNKFLKDKLINISEDKVLSISSKGLNLLEPYKVSKAIIIAAGFGSRLVPVTLNTPKPLIIVNGKRIIDTLIDSIIKVGIKDITVVRGYKKEKFNELLVKYPFLKFIDNDIYNLSNNISSVYSAKDIIDNCYICEADLFVSNSDIIEKYQYSSNYLGSFVKETDDWCFYTKNGYISSVSIGGENCYHMIGISYWNRKDSIILRKDVEDAYNSKGGKENFWDNVPLKIHKKHYRLEVRETLKSNVTEIDTFDELKLLDNSYNNYNI